MVALQGQAADAVLLAQFILSGQLWEQEVIKLPLGLNDPAVTYVFRCVQLLHPNYIVQIKRVV